MIKNILISIILLTSSFKTSHSQNLSLDLNKTEKSEQEMVTQHKDVELIIGSLKIYSPFLYKGEYTPHQGYLIKFKDYIRLQDIVVGSQTSNEALISAIQKGYNEKLLKCQSDCDIRVKRLQDDKDLLILKNKDLTKKVESIKTSRIIWSVSSTIIGAGLGVLVYEIAR